MKPTFWIIKIIEPSWNSLSHFPNPPTWTTLSHLSNLLQLSLTLLNILFKVSNGWTPSQQCILSFSVSHLVLLIFLFSIFLTTTIFFLFFFLRCVKLRRRQSHCALLQHCLRRRRHLLVVVVDVLCFGFALLDESVALVSLD